LAIAFTAIIFLFIYRSSSNTAVLEEKTAKEIALAIDSARAETGIMADMDDVLKKNEGVLQPIKISGNVVTVQLSDKGGFSYGFFNAVDVTSYITNADGRAYLVLKISRKK
jgi:hypothetical protein